MGFKYILRSERMRPARGGCPGFRSTSIYSPLFLISQISTEVVYGLFVSVYRMRIGVNNVDININIDDNDGNKTTYSIITRFKVDAGNGVEGSRKGDITRLESRRFVRNTLLNLSTFTTHPFLLFSLEEQEGILGFLSKGLFSLLQHLIAVINRR